MKTKKTIAAITAILMAAASVNALPFAAYADTAAGSVLDGVSETLETGTETSAVLTSEGYSALTDEQKADYVLVSSIQAPAHARYNDTEIGSGSYVKKGITFMLYVYSAEGGINFLVNGEYIAVTNTWASAEYYSVEYTVGNDAAALEITTSEQWLAGSEMYERLSAENKRKFVKVNFQTPINVNMPEINSDIDNNIYVMKGVQLYISVPAADLEGKTLCLNGTPVNAEANEDGSVCGVFYTIGENDTALNFSLEDSADKTGGICITAAEYAALTDEQKSMYAQVNADGVAAAYEGNGPDEQGTGIPSGSYVKKGTDIFFGMDAYAFKGHILNVFHDSTAENWMTVEHFRPDGMGVGWVYGCTVADDDIVITAEAVDGRHPISISPNEYANLPNEWKCYYAKASVQSPAYIWVGDDETGGEIADGNYVLKGTDLWIAMLVKDYVNNDFLINGQIAEPVFVGGNYGFSFVVFPGENELNVTAQPTASVRSTVKIEDGTGIEVSYYVDDWTNGEQIKDGEAVRVGTPLLIGCYKNLISGYDITVNGKVLPLHLNGDGTYMLNGYTPDSAETVIRRVKRSELSEYEKANCVPVYFGNKIEVYEFPFSEGSSGDEWNIYYDNGDIIEKGSRLFIEAAPADYAGKELKINGTVYDMFLNGDRTRYITVYTIPDSVTSLNITLENKTGITVPEAPPRPSTQVSAPVIPSSGAPSVTESTGNANAPTETAVVKGLKKSGKTSLSYDASDAGVTEDILKAFADNKRAKTITAKFDSFKIKIRKSDIEDAKSLETIDLSISEKNFISKSQIGKTKALKNCEKVVQLNFEGSTEFSGLKKITVQAKAGKALKNSTAAVYELKGKKLVKIGTATVDKNGYVSFETDHLGQFVIAVN